MVYHSFIHTAIIPPGSETSEQGHFPESVEMYLQINVNLKKIPQMRALSLFSERFAFLP